MRKFRALGIVLCIAALSGCGDDGEGAPATATPAATNTFTAIATNTNTPADTNTPTPTHSPTPSDPLLVLTDAGAVRGKLDNGVRSFLGVPYAAPPVGALRWRPPQPHPGWSGERDATLPGSSCKQIIPIANLPAGGEDCLYLNVHAPDSAPAALLPVMVWIHGGGFVTGDGLQYTGGTDGGNLARIGGVIVVSINYRLAQFGFLAHSGLTGEDPDHPTSGGYGIEDQQAALRWVQRNIAAFGGDPDNVTIFGESAGGWSVCIHMVSPGSRGLFHRAIVQSGLCVQRMATLTAAEAQGDTFAERLGCSTAADVVACMRSKSADEVRDALPPDPNFALTPGEWGSYLPIVDGVVIPQHMRDSFAAGNFERVPTLIGSNADEGTLFIAIANDNHDMPVTAEGYPELLQRLLGDETLVERVVAQYPLEQYETPSLTLSAAFGDGFLACPTIDTAKLVSAFVPTYLYEFEFPDAGFQLPLEGTLGAFHSAEIQYVFQHPAMLGQMTFPADELELSNRMIGYWTNFAKAADPNGSGLPAWPVYDETKPHLVFDRAISTGNDAKGAACAFWTDLGFDRSMLGE